MSVTKSCQKNNVFPHHQNLIYALLEIHIQIVTGLFVRTLRAYYMHITKLLTKVSLGAVQEKK